MLHVDAKLLNLYLACKQQQLYGPVNYREEKQAPGPNCSNAGLEESLSSGLISIRVANFITQWIDNSVFIQRIVFCTF